MRDFNQPSRPLEMDNMEGRDTELEGVVDALEEGIALIEPDFTIRYVNKAYRKLLSIDDPQVIGRKCYDVAHGSDGPVFNCPCLEALDSKITTKNNIKGKNGDGELVACAIPALNEEGGIVHLIERLSTKEPIQLDQPIIQEMMLLAEHSSESVLLVEGGMIRFVNKKGAQLLGRSLEDLINTDFTSVIGEGYRDTLMERLRKRASGKDIHEPLKLSLRNGAGEVIKVKAEATITRATGKMGLLIFLTPEEAGSKEVGEDESHLYLPALMEPRSMIEDLLESEGRREAKTKEPIIKADDTYETILSHLPGMAYRCLNDPDWTLIFASEGCLELTGYSREDLIESEGITYGDLIHPDDREDVWKGVQEAISERRQFKLNYRIITKEGDLKHVWEQGIGVTDASGQVNHLEGFITDVTAQQLAESKTRESSAFLKNIIENSGDSIVVTDKNSRIILWNSGAETLFGFKAEEVLGKEIGFLYSDDLKEERAKWQRAVFEKKTLRNIGTRIIDASGNFLDINMTLSPLLDGDGILMGAVGVSKDTTELVKAQEKLKKKISELEEFHRLTVERELKMMELESELRKIRG